MRRIRVWMLAAFFLSGACGLAYEILALRLFRVTIGSATAAITTVLCAYMSGMALGSLIGGWLSERRGDLLRVFALFQFGIAFYFIAFPFLLDMTGPLYRVIYPGAGNSMQVFNILRFLICWLTLLIPCTLMGATLPVLSRFFASAPEEAGCSTGILYAVNTIGGAVGAFSAGFIFLPALGAQAALLLACGLSCLAGAIAFYFHRCTDDVPVEKHSDAGAFKGVAGLVLVCGYAAAGFAALVYEVSWTRVLCSIMGSSVYAFSMMLTVFILGIGLGSIIFSRLAGKTRRPVVALSAVEMGVGLSALLVVPLIAGLPAMTTKVILRTGGSFAALQAAEFGLIMLIMLVPTLLMGAAFPLAVRRMAELDGTTGRSVGRLCGMNILGCIFGSVAAGYWFIPAVGIQETIYIAVLINVVAGFLFLLTADGMSWGRKFIWILASVVIVVGIIKATPVWDRETMSFGAFVQARRTMLGFDEESFKGSDKDTILFYKEGVSATVSVRQTDKGERVMIIDGKPDASSVADLRTEMMAAHVPMLIHKKPRKVLLIGLATGITAGSVCIHDIEKLDCVEISSAVIEASRKFDADNHKVAENSRFQIIMGDGRSHLELSDETYDVIISGPSNPWISGISDLFTREFFELCRKRLNPDGVFCTWVESYTLNLECFQSVAATFSEVFPEMNLWSPMSSDHLLVGFKGRQMIDAETLQNRFADSGLTKDFKRIDIMNVSDFLGNCVADGDGVRRIAGDMQVHTDDNGLLEFRGPGSMIVNRDQVATRVLIEANRANDLSFLVSGNAEMPFVTEAEKYVQARGHAERGYTLINTGDTEKGIEELKSAASGNKRDPVLRKALRVSLSKAALLLRIGQIDNAEVLYRGILEISPVSAEVHYGLGFVSAFRKDSEGALKHYLSAVRFDSKNPFYNVALAAAAWEQGLSAVAAKHYKIAIILKPDWPEIAYNLSVVLASARESNVRDVSGAIQVAIRALKLAEEQGNAKLAEVIKNHITALGSRK